MTDERLSISEVAKRLNRRPNTVRGWDREGLLPEELKSHRDDNGWRFWLESQMPGLAQWIIDADRRPGKGLPNYKPTKEEAEAHVRTVRRKRTKSVLLEDE